MIELRRVKNPGVCAYRPCSTPNARFVFDDDELDLTCRACSEECAEDIMIELRKLTQQQRDQLWPRSTK